MRIFAARYNVPKWYLGQKYENATMVALVEQQKEYDVGGFRRGSDTEIRLFRAQYG